MLHVAAEIIFPNHISDPVIPGSRSLVLDPICEFCISLRVTELSEAQFPCLYNEGVDD